ncbi:AsmA family protein [Aquimarina intermedia]|uniref:AsmA-like protein n=1 Tax=Aquimarina intermedia TaxID=350814 RepID=A0A5S5C982_9FLAO|nr:AsmA-like C-terminal region-containing protein [Aquimarina intermedia]TYP75965.1 AsmA-like protein [Aquimarina intermedia]
MKKALKIIGIVIVVIIIALISIPFLFKNTIKDKVRYAINREVNATVDFSDISLSLFRSFPQASVIVNELSIITAAPFAGDTLVFTDQLSLEMSVKELFKDASEPIAINQIKIDKAFINIKIDSLGRFNYDIAKKDSIVASQTPQDTQGKPFIFDLQNLEINSSRFVYDDQVAKTLFTLDSLQLTGSGDISEQQSEVTLEAYSKIAMAINGVEYLSNNNLALEAVVGIDLEKQRYTFKENTGYINQLPLTFDGYVEVHDKDTEVDIQFKTPSSDFKNFLAVIPQTYSKNLDGITTTGDFMVDGKVKGTVDETTIPTMDIKITSTNASFKYPDLPKSVRNINLKTSLMNTTGKVDDTYINLDQLVFTIDQDVFSAKGNFKNITKNMLVDMAVNGTLNLANLEQAYPIQLEEKLRGVVKANIITAFDMESLEKENYEKIKTSGKATLSNFEYTTPELPDAIKVNEALVNFKPGTITLDKMDIASGKSDIKATGTINNLLGFIFTEQKLKGNFNVQSNTFYVSDFMSQEEAASSTTKKAAEKESSSSSPSSSDFKIPSFLDATLAFTANTVVYDNLNLKNAKGVVKIKEETASLENVTSSLFDGVISLDGNVSTKSQTPTFGMKLNLDNIDIAKSFEGMELLRSLAPIAKALTGMLSTDLELKGNLTSDLSPQLNTLKGNALAEILNAKVNSSETKLLSKLDGALSFIDLDNLDLKDIKTALNFDDGKINVKPFNFEVKGIKITAQGNHSFTNEMNYTVALDLPAKYLGDDLGSTISQLSEEDLSKMTVALPIGISGNFSDPVINLNTKAAVKQLTQQIVATQKDKAKDKLVNKGKGVLSDVLGGASTKKDSTTSTPVKVEDKVKEAAKDILGGFFGKKKKKDTVKN